jgi:anti-sigma-K factor RskA
VTPNGSAHEQWEELAAGYVLDALEPDEEQALLDHLSNCADCRRVVDEHAFVAAQLGQLAEDSDITPPSWSAIRSGIVTDPSAPVVSLEDRRRHRRPPLLLGAAAAAVLLAGAGVVGWQLASGDSGEPSQSKTLAACAASPSCHVVRLQSDNTVAAYALAEKGTVTMLPTHMAAPAAGHVYALWQLPRDGRPTLVTVLRTVDNGVSSAAPLVLPYADTAAFAVSVEPADVVPTTPTEVVATGAATA